MDSFCTPGPATCLTETATPSNLFFEPTSDTSPERSAPSTETGTSTNTSFEANPVTSPKEKISSDSYSAEPSPNTSADEAGTSTDSTCNSSIATSPSDTPNPNLSSQIHNLSTFPLDIINEIFDFLTPVQSACFGLTCRSLYEIHTARHGKVGLHEIDFLNQESLTSQTTTTLLGCTAMVNGIARKKVMLGELLKDWMGPDLKLWAQFRNTSTVRYWTIQYEWTPKKVVYIKKEGN
jgi:hypothetical protein